MNQISDQINLLHDKLIIDPVIDSVSSTASAEFKKRFLKILIGAFIFASLCAIAFMIFFGDILRADPEEATPIIIGFFLVMTILPLTFYYAKLTDKFHHAFMVQFARLNNFTYSKTAPVPEEQANIFFLGHSKKVTNFISGTLFDRPIFLYNYYFTTSRDKATNHSSYTIFNIDLPYSVPSIIFQPAALNFAFLFTDIVYGDAKQSNSYSNKVSVNLEGDLGKYFKLWVEKKFEIEALQIFTEKFLYQLFTDWNSFHIEFIDNNMYVYTDHIVTTKAELESMFALAKALLAHVDKISNRLSSSTDALKEHFEPKL